MLFSPGIRAINRWFPGILNRKPSLGKLLATSDTPALARWVSEERQWGSVISLFSTDAAAHPEQAAQTHLFLALGALGLSSVGLLGMPALTLITLPVQAYFVARFIESGIKQVIKKHHVGMAVIDGVVTTALLSLGYFWALSLYAACFYWSRSMVQRSRNRYQQNMLLIASTPPQHLRVMRDATEVQIGLDALDMADTIIVYAGEVVPVDGVVLDGAASIDQRLLTGEAQPVERSRGEHVFAMTLVLSGRLSIRAEQTGASTVSAQVGTLLHHIRSYTTLLTLRAEAVGNRYALPMLALSGATLFVLGPMSALTVLCSYIGYSMRISGPLSMLNYLTLAAQHQMVLKDGRALEILHQVDTVIFDKTGTLTEDQPHVVNIYAYSTYSEHEILTMAAAAESHQTHPIAQAILQAAHERQLPLPPLSEVAYEPGVGLKVKIAGRTLHVVGPRFLEREAISLPLSAETAQAYCYQRGHSLVYVVLGDTVIGTIELAPTIRAEAQQVVTTLQHLGKTVLIVSGDHKQPTRWLATTLEVDSYHAEMLPAEKATLVAQLQQDGKTVCFVGDGINDALALKQANVSISMHGASGLALDTAQVVVLNTNLAQLLVLFKLGRHLHTSMQGNLVLSIVPGVITIGGVYLLNFGLVAAYILYYAGFAAGITNAMLPLSLARPAPESEYMSSIPR